eukprot:COSAG01_NODE_33047_length_570_cov_228.685775_1_plen_112_part_01
MGAPRSDLPTAQKCTHDAQTAATAQTAGDPVSALTDHRVEECPLVLFLEILWGAAVYGKKLIQPIDEQQDRRPPHCRTAVAPVQHRRRWRCSRDPRSQVGVGDPGVASAAAH